MQLNLVSSAILLIILSCISAYAQSDIDKDIVSEKLRSDMAFHFSKCPMSSMSNVDRTECLHKQVNIAKSKMNFVLKKEYTMAESYAVNRDGTDPEVAKKIKMLKNDIRNSQAAWQNYSIKQCDAVVNSYEIRGGTGGAAEMLECQLRLLVLRLYELSLTGAMRE